MKINFQKIKRLSCRYASFLAVCLLFICMSVPAFAVENDYTVSGHWVMNDVLTFSEFDEPLYGSGTFPFNGYVVTSNVSRVCCVRNSNTEGFYVYVVVESEEPPLNVSDQYPYEFIVYSNDAKWANLPGVQSWFFGDTPQPVSKTFYDWLHANGHQMTFSDTTTAVLPIVLGWVGSVVSSLFSGELSGLLILVAIPVAIVIVFLGARLLRRLWWGA